MSGANFIMNWQFNMHHPENRNWSFPTFKYGYWYTLHVSGTTNVKQGKCYFIINLFIVLKKDMYELTI